MIAFLTDLALLAYARSWAHGPFSALVRSQRGGGRVVRRDVRLAWTVRVKGGSTVEAGSEA